jgi:membrane protease YdiL (CAAX protease family)
VFVLGATFLGVGYGWLAWRTGSIGSTTLAHVAMGSLRMASTADSSNNGLS